MNEKTIKNWLALAEYDFNTAQSMLKSGRYLYIVFTCQQTIEKCLKALYIIEKKITPPYTHNLLRLANDLAIYKEINEDQIIFLTELNQFYIESRYNENIVRLTNKINQNKAENIYNCNYSPPEMEF